ncbi:hypothetical protein PIB30_033922 [Stylosanthes scabra]|uniref:Uncharacterized protein n=1 Tax=Stylosanthes scabra TaxID=79078 RepID=A0ABU6XAP8_9FABA|nr:hypothetical protein [Stylosanthes scabra]
MNVTAYDPKAGRDVCIDYGDKKLMYLDSCKSDDAEETIRCTNQMREVVNSIGYPHHLHNSTKYQRLLLIFDLQTMQAKMDFGVRVCQWMINSYKWLDYDIEPIDDSTRMHIAVQLVVGPHNTLAKSITQKAVKFWNS